MNVTFTACALHPDSPINSLHVYDKRVFKTFQDVAAQGQCVCWWDEQEGVWQQGFEVIWIFLYGRDKIADDAASLPGC